MTFRGSLAEVSLADILQLVAVSNRTGVLALRMGDLRGEIHIDQGQIHHAATERLRGDAAFYELARWHSGDFEFAQDAQLAARTMEKPTPALLAEALRQAAEWKVLATRISSTRMVPVLAPEAASGVSLAAHEWAIVSRVDGRRSLEEIAAALGQSPFEVCKVVFGLLSTGVVTLLSGAVPERAEPRRTEPPVRVERRAVDLASARSRISELVYRGLGPNGETHVIKIEKTQSVEDLVKAASACRDFLIKIGRQEVAELVSAELDHLG